VSHLQKGEHYGLSTILENKASIVELGFDIRGIRDLARQRCADPQRL